MTDIKYPEFRDELEPTKYPFGEQATLKNSEGDSLLEGTFLGAMLYPVGGQERMYLSKVTITYSTVTFTIGDHASDDLASGSFDLLDTPSLVSLEDAYGRPAGVLVSEPDRLASFQSWDVGEHVFRLEQTEFCPAVCCPTPELGVRGFLLDDGSVLTGDVWFVGDDGVVLRQETTVLPGACGEPDITVPVIRLDVIGDPLFRRRLCEPNDLFTTPRFVKQINFVMEDTFIMTLPDPQGNIQLLVGDDLADDTVLRIRNTEEGLVFEVAGDDIEKAAG